jgi:tyrosine-protein kinase Fer
LRLANRKNILVEASNIGDLTSDKHLEIQKRIDAALLAVNASDEYRDFTEKHRFVLRHVSSGIIEINFSPCRSSSALPVIFRFDDQLIEDTVGKLQPNQLTVDNLTVDWLRQRIVDLETSVKDCQEKQTKIQGDSNGKISSSSASLPTTPTSHTSNGLNSSNGTNGSNGSLKDTK